MHKKVLEVLDPQNHYIVPPLQIITLSPHYKSLHCAPITNHYIVPPLQIITLCPHYKSLHCAPITNHFIVPPLQIITLCPHHKSFRYRKDKHSFKVCKGRVCIKFIGNAFLILHSVYTKKET